MLDQSTDNAKQSIENPPVNVLMDELANQIDRIETQRVRLLGRVERVLTPAAPAHEAPELAADHPGSSQHVHALAALVRQASAIADEIADITRRLEI